MKKYISIFKGWVGFGLLATMVFAFYLFARSINRSIYATDAEYLNPSSWLDTIWSQILVMGAFAGLYILRVRQEMLPPRPLIPAKAADDEAIRRRRDAKRFNERLKLIANALSTAGTSALVAGFLVPVLQTDDIRAQFSYMGVIIAFLCYACAQVAIGFWKSEE